MNRLSWKLTLAAVVLFVSTGTASADPPDVKTLAIGSSAPDFRLPGVDGKDLQPGGFCQEQDLVRHLHLQSLSDRPGV